MTTSTITTQLRHFTVGRTIAISNRFKRASILGAQKKKQRIKKDLQNIKITSIVGTVQVLSLCVCESASGMTPALLIVFAIIIVASVVVVTGILESQKCMFQDTCERCLSANFKCSWCSDKTYDRRYRCLERDELLANGCDEKYIWENEQRLEVLSNVDLHDYEDVNQRAIQIQPQKIHIKLVKLQTQRIQLTYRPARNHVLDLYYLMDLTWTMRDDKQTLVAMGAELAAALRNLTGNYRLGFGSFADKPTMPMIMPQLRDNPCAAEHEVCEPTYGFRHRLPLTDDVGDFVRSVNASRITGNLDNLEGGFDALMQVIVCSDQIGWQPHSRKIVILATDGFMHFAGDGLLAGIVRANDKKCHLDVISGEYLGTLNYDYPSLEEMYKELQRRKVKVIFAVTENVVNTYREMSSLMQDMANVEILRADSSNILELIKKSYATFVKRAQFDDDSPSFIRFDYETNCGGQFDSLRTRNYCKNVDMGKEVVFFVNITLTDFPNDGIFSRKIRIEESSLSESLEIDIEIQRPCPCEEETVDDEWGRFQCSGTGIMHCGMCQCDEGWAGVFCSCASDPINTTTSEAIERECRRSFSNSLDLGPVCSNHGECDCGTCYCFQGYMGKYCECPDCDSDCDPERAECHCGKCICKYGWSGNRCNCRLSTEGCRAPDGEVCSIHGDCECGKCRCDENHFGRFCEIGGAENENRLCIFYEPCVQCLIQAKQGGALHCGNITEICSSVDEQKEYQYAFVENDIDADVRCLARVTNEAGIKCDHFFTYKSLTSTESYILIQMNNCEPLNYYALFSYMGLATLLVGLTIIFAFVLCIRAQDRYEYAKFQEEQRRSTLMESPLYKDPIRVYKVPEAIRDEY